MKVERVSYEVMTASAARGVVEAILYKPAICWSIHRIEVLAPIRWLAFRRNEVNTRASDKVAHLVVDEDRAQRNTLALRDVDYVIHASFGLSAQAGPDETLLKFESMFERRLGKGQHFHQPYLGCREFAADVEPAPAAVETSADPTVSVDRPLGMVFYDWHWPSTGEAALPLFFAAHLKQGVVHVPPREDVLRENGVLSP
jgi:CRISPR-associated protein Cas5d